MSAKYLAFDIETAKVIPGEEFDWHGHRPLGISCAATLKSGSDKPRHWYSKSKDGTPTGRMTTRSAKLLVDHLAKMVASGYTIVTWNGLGFDFDVLAEESQSPAACRELALNHVDMMFHLFCHLGYPVSLQKAAEGLGLPGKSLGMTGAEAPRLWAQGAYEKVLEYVGQDVRTTVQIAQSCDHSRQFHWITQKGSKKSVPLAKGWLTVRQAMRLPEPDTLWMSSRLSRRAFSDWLSGR